MFATADAVGLPDPITTQLTEVFSGDVDFLHDVRRGDRFMVVYEAGHQGDRSHVFTIDGREKAPAAMTPSSFMENGTPLAFNDDVGTPTGLSREVAFHDLRRVPLP